MLAKTKELYQNFLLCKKGGVFMREEIIKRILDLTEEQAEELMTLLQQYEEEGQVSQARHQTYS